MNEALVAWIADHLAGAAYFSAGLLAGLILGTAITIWKVRRMLADREKGWDNEF